jgi:hypothetical protein
VNRVPEALLSETRTIADAVRRIREDAQILAVARRSVADALDLLGLTGTPREAVRPLLIAATSTGVETHILKPQTFWFG